MNQSEMIKHRIQEGKAVLGIELGSTRIKSVLIDTDYKPIASGEHAWTNSYEQGIWTYTLDEVWNGLQESYKALKKDVNQRYGAKLSTVKAMGISGMMHGYLAFDKHEHLLVPFRTWRNNITQEASVQLMDLFNYPIPQRWSIAHLYQAILNQEEHVREVDYITTLSGYVHWKLTGNKVLGIGDASGMFPIDIHHQTFHPRMIEAFDEHISGKGFAWKLGDILPKTLVAGEDAGTLTPEGARLIDPSGELCGDIPLCPPEGDAGTGMVATNSVAERTGNVSAGTSIFAMVVLENELSRVYKELDLVTTPSGKLVAMAHSNNCTSDLDAWVNIFDEVGQLFGASIDKTTLYQALYNKALEGEADGGGLLAYGYLSGEHITKFEEGRPLFTRLSDSTFSLANFMRVHLQTSLGAMKIGTDILLKKEKVVLDKMLGHGGLFKTPGVGQRLMAAAVNAPVEVMETAGEGGAWGIAILAAYLDYAKQDKRLESFLDTQVFSQQESTRIDPVIEDVEGFEQFMRYYVNGLDIERAAVEHFHST
ncbi:FGGY-family carbohydrate kinase [Vallitaleaceae bacterium 9-2]